MFPRWTRSFRAEAGESDSGAAMSLSLGGRPSSRVSYWQGSRVRSVPSGDGRENVEVDCLPPSILWTFVSILCISGCCRDKPVVKGARHADLCELNACPELGFRPVQATWYPSQRFDSLFRYASFIPLTSPWSPTHSGTDLSHPSAARCRLRDYEPTERCSLLVRGLHIRPRPKRCRCILFYA